MRRIRVAGLVLAALGGVTLAACNFVLGLGGYANTGGTGGASSNSSASTGSTGAMDGGTGGDAASDGDAGPVNTAGQGVWSKAFTGATVAAMAGGPDGTVYLTGSGAPSAFNCTSTSDAGTGAGVGYVVQLDTTGVCVWGFFFGTSTPGTQGTGVAVDEAGNVAVTATFVGASSFIGAWPPATMGMHTNSFVVVFGSDHGLKWARLLSDDSGPMGDQLTTGVALNGSGLTVSGSYNGTVAALSPPAGPGKMTVGPTSDGTDAFVAGFDADGGTFVALPITSMTTMGAQVASAVALDEAKNELVVVGTTQGAVSINGGSALVPSGGSVYNIFLAAYTVSKVETFQLVFDGTLFQGEPAVAFDLTDDVFVGGQFSGSATLSRYESDGGITLSSSGTNKDVLIGRYDLTGTPLAALQLGTTEDATLAGIAAWPAPSFAGTMPGGGPSVVFAGSFSGTAALLAGGPMLKSMGGFPNAYVVKVDSTLTQVVWAQRFGDGTFAGQSASAVTVDPSDGSVFVAGQFQGKVDFGGPTSPLFSPSAPSLFVAKLQP